MVSMFLFTFLHSPRHDHYHGDWSRYVPFCTVQSELYHHLIECYLFSSWYSWKIARLTLNNNNNHSLLTWHNCASESHVDRDQFILYFKTYLCLFVKLRFYIAYFLFLSSKRKTSLNVIPGMKSRDRENSTRTESSFELMNKM
jgi:hypothetical protein